MRWEIIIWVTKKQFNDHESKLFMNVDDTVSVKKILKMITPTSFSISSSNIYVSIGYK
jgi:hypothetical protein